MVDPAPRNAALWYYLPGAKIVRASECRDPSAALYSAAEGDRKWEPVARPSECLKARDQR